MLVISKKDNRLNVSIKINDVGSDELSTSKNGCQWYSQPLTYDLANMIIEALEEYKHKSYN